MNRETKKQYINASKEKIS